VWGWQPASVSWYGEGFHRLGVQSAKVLALLLLYLHQTWLQHLSQVPDSQSLCCLWLCHSCHFGFSLFSFFIIFPKNLSLCSFYCVGFQCKENHRIWRRLLRKLKKAL
jgi:hypothetical protein